MTIFTPINQVKLTNVSVVRLKKGGKRFEIACFKNKILDWKNKLTTDLNQVLQTDSIFTNVSKGQVANKEELAAAFPALTAGEIVLEILKKGEVQLGEKERTHQLDTAWKDIARIVTEKCINPSTQLPYSMEVIEKAMTSAHYSIAPSKNSKQQALEVIKLIQRKDILPIKRALMKLAVFLPSAKETKKIREALLVLTARLESEEWESDGTLQLVVLCEPGNYRKIYEHVSLTTKGKGTVATLSTAEVGDEE